MIAALFVQEGGAYYGIPDVDPWPESRDARLYAGPWPVVAHPPCERWSRLAHIHKHKPGKGIGEDNGCFASALRSVRNGGGVLEHPAGSEAWPRFGLTKPEPYGGWSLTVDGGWVCEVEQGHFGHPAPKSTWLYAFGIIPPFMFRGPSGAKGRIELMPSTGKRDVTPTAFRDLLLSIARSAHREAA